MVKVYTSAMVIIPSEEIWPFIQKIRRTYDRHYYRWMPHITLLYPFRPENEFEVIKGRLDNLCKGINPFNIRLSEFKYFSHKSQNFTLWIDPEPRDLIKSLQNDLLSLFPDCNDVNLHKNGYIPHLSVGQVRGKNNLMSILDEFQENWEELRFNLEKISLISRKPFKNSRFEIKKTISLKN